MRVDSGLHAGTVIGSDYDPMLSKVIAYGPDRAVALARLDQALADTQVLGVRTNTDFLRFLLADPDVIAGELDTGLLDRRAEDFRPAPVTDDQFTAAAYRGGCDRGRPRRAGPGRFPTAGGSGRRHRRCIGSKAVIALCTWRSRAHRMRRSSPWTRRIRVH